MSFWEQVWSTVIGGAMLALLGWLAALVWGAIQRRMGKRPDWIATLEPGGALTLERPRRGVAFEVTGGVIGDEGKNVLHLDTTMVQDVRKGESFTIHVGSEGRRLLLRWIDKQRLETHTLIPTEVGVPMPITAKRRRRRLRLVRD